MVKAVRHFKHHLCSLHFVIRTDHASLRWLLSFREPEARWIECLQEFQFTIQHRKGGSHQNADGLSRRTCMASCPQCQRLVGYVKQGPADKTPEMGMEASCCAVPDSNVTWVTEQRKEFLDSCLLSVSPGKVQNITIYCINIYLSLTSSILVRRPQK